MDQLAGFSMLVAGNAVVVVPLVATWRHGRINAQFPWVFTASAFLLLNCVGAYSPNVLDGRHAPTFYLLMLATSLALAVAFVLCDRIAPAFARPLQIAGLARGAWYDSASLRLSFVLLLMASMLLVAIFSMVVAPPLLFRFDLYGDWATLIATRIAIVKASNFNWFALGFFELPLFAAIFSSIMAHITQRTVSSDAHFWHRARVVAVAYALLTSIMFLHRHYIVYVLAAVFVVSIWARGMSVARVSIFMLIGLSTLFALYAAYGGTSAADTLLWTIWHRAFEVYPWTAAEVTDIFTREQALLGGSSLINLFGLFQFQQVDLAAQVYPRIYGNLGLGEALGSAPVPAVFESYANFGWLGAVITLIVLVAVLMWLHQLWRSDSPWFVAVAMFLTVKLALFWQSPVWFGFLEPSLVLLVAGLLVWHLIAPLRRVPAGKPA